MSKAIIQAENHWRAAYDANERFSTARTLQAEQKAWDTYAELCDEARQCLQPGCRTESREWAYCPEHRAR